MLALLVVAILAGPVAALEEETADHGTVVVTLGDGTSLPLHSWSLSYEYVAWKQGTSQLSSSPMRKEQHVLWVGKKAVPTDGLAVTIEHGELDREVEVDGKAATVKVKVARELKLRTADGKKSGMKVEPPPRDFLLPGAGGGWMIMPRSLDLRGQTVTGTRKDFCLLSYTTLVECGGAPGDTVVKFEFQR